MFSKRQLIEIKSKALVKFHNDFLKDGDFVRLQQRKSALDTNLKKLLKTKGLKSGFEEFLLDDWELI